MLTITFDRQDVDFTPKGKRAARIVQASKSRQLRWYVSGKLYRKLPITNENLAMTQDWMAA